MVVYKDKERGTYYFMTRIQMKNGKTKQVKRRGFKTQREAKKAEAELLLNEDEFDGSYSFEFVANEYLGWYKKRRKASSYLKISSIINTHLLPRFGNKSLNAIRPRDVTKYQDELIDKYAVSHIKKIHTTLSAVFNYAITQEYTKENPAKKVGNVELPEEKHMNYWTLEEFREFIQQVDEPLYYALFMTLYYSGMRKGELLALTWRDIDFDTKTIAVNKTTYNGNVTTPKTKASTRKIAMPEHVINLLAKLKANKEKEIVQQLSYVVFGDFFDPISTTTLDRKFEKYVKLAGVKKIRLHDFRHSHASYLINRNIIISVIAKRLGHGDVATTLNTYSHLYPTTEKEAVSQMENDF